MSPKYQYMQDRVNEITKLDNETLGKKLREYLIEFEINDDESYDEILIEFMNDFIKFIK